MSFNKSNCIIEFKVKNETLNMQLTGTTKALLAGIACIIDKISEDADIPITELMNALLLSLIKDRPERNSDRGE